MAGINVPAGLNLGGVDTDVYANVGGLWLPRSIADLRADLGVLDETESDARYLAAANDLADLADPATARTNLGLGTAAVLDVNGGGDAGAGQVVKGNDTRLTDSRAPSGSAGGVLGGTYPNPTFNADMATQAELDAHAALTAAHGVTGAVVGTSDTQTLTNKTVDANGTGNSISNLEVPDFASGVIDTDLSNVSGSDDTLPSAKATKTALDGKQPLDAELTSLAGLSHAANAVIQSDGAAFRLRSLANYKTDLALVKGDVDLGNVLNTKHNYAASDVPNALDDGPDGGYSVGSLWYYPALNKWWVCSDATNNAAIWRTISDYPNLHTALVPPTTGDDSVDGYEAGSIWIDTGAGHAYVCVAPTFGLANWRQIDRLIVAGDEANAVGTTALARIRFPNGSVTQNSTGDLSISHGPLHNLAATTAPTVNEDSGDGYSVGSVWIDVTNDRAYICLDATGSAAVWRRTDLTAATASAAGTLSAAHYTKLDALATITSALYGLDLTSGVLSRRYSGARVYNSAALAVPTGTGGLVATFNSERWDSGGVYHSTALNTNRLVAPQAGTYRITGHFMFAASTAGTYRILTIRNQAGTPLAVDQKPPATAGLPVRLSATTTWPMAANDWMEFFLQQDSGGALNVSAVGNESPEGIIDFEGI